MNKKHLTAPLLGRGQGRFPLLGKAWGKILLLSFFTFFSPFVWDGGISAGDSSLLLRGSRRGLEGVMTKQPDGTYVVNTTELCNARGYKSTTPVEVHIKSGKVVKVVPLPHKETPKYYRIAATALFGQFANLKVNKALEKAESPNVDGCTGATMSAKALQQNIKAALNYYKKNK